MVLLVGHFHPMRRIAFQFLRLCHNFLVGVDISGSRTRDHEPEEEVSDWKYVWRKDHGYFTFAKVVSPAWFEGDEDTSSGGVLQSAWVDPVELSYCSSLAQMSSCPVDCIFERKNPPDDE
jgi:hypothetical protein